MKPITLILSLIILCAQSSLFSMDIPTPQTTPALSQKQIITKISDAINIKYASNDYFASVFNPFNAKLLTPNNFSDIAKLTTENYPQDRTDSKEIFDKLYVQNSFFKQTVDYFADRASDNLKLLTANNIKTIENPKKQQPITELNKLSLPFKTYVMNRALAEIEYSYDIVLSGPHSDDIQAFDICQATHQAVTSSFNKQFYINKDTTNVSNNQLILWNLKTGKATRTFNELSPIKLLAFNLDGSCIAAAVHNENTIKIWCPQTNQLLHKLSAEYRIDDLAYSFPTHSLLTALHRINTEHTRMTQWLLTDAKAGSCLNSMCLQGPRIRHKHKYHTKIVKQNELHIKSDCVHLSLCLNAIQNTNPTEMVQKNIQTSISFLNSTDMEQKKVHAAIQQKLNTAQKDNKLELYNR